MSQICLNAAIALLLVLAGLPASVASAKVSARVCLADEVTPLALADPNVPEVYRDIMVGTRLTIFITSDTAGSWDGQVWVSNSNAVKGLVTGRGQDSENPSMIHEASRLEASGKGSRVVESWDPNGVSFNLICIPDATIGDWFVLDYRALTPGVCCVGLYANSPTSPPGDERDPYTDEAPPFGVDLLEVLCFSHVPSRDFNGDTLVNFVDYASLAGLWGGTVVSDPNAPVAPDLNADERVDVLDLALFSEYWLERTEAVGPAPDPNEMDSMP